MLLYHGTSEAKLVSIMRDGIVPRADEVGNWGHTVHSNEEAVYLSIAYPLYFASHAVSEDADETVRLIVLEIDTDLIDDAFLCADEDALEQALRGHDDFGDLTISERTDHYKSVMGRYTAEASLKALGNCALIGTVPPEAITRVAFVDMRTYAEMVRHGYDPFISVGNYQACGEGYRASTKWLFDPEAVTQKYYDLGNGHRHPIFPILDDRKGIQVVHATELASSL